MADDDQEQALALFREHPLADMPVVRVSTLLAARLKTLSDRTREAYARDYESFRTFVDAPTVDEALIRLVLSPGDIAMTVVLAFQGALLAEGLAPATVNRRISAIRAAMAIARKAQLTNTELSVDQVDPEIETRDVRGPGMEAIRRMIAVCDEGAGASEVRDGTIFRWLILIGLRRNELRQLLMRHVALEGEQTGIRVAQKGKRKLHMIQLSDAILATSSAWLELRGTSRGAFFCSLDRRRVGDRSMLNPTALNRIVRRRAIEAGFADARMPDGRFITPHGFRHTAITQVIRKHGLAAAQAFARHANPATTDRYNDEKHKMALEAHAFMLGEL